MNAIQRIVPCLAGLVLIVSPLTACQPQNPSLTEKEARYMETLKKKMTPRCIGRYLVDLPEDMVLNTEALQTIDEVMIDVRPMAEQIFKDMLATRTQKLKAQSIDGEPETGTLKSITPLNDVPGLVFDRSESTVSNVLRTLELRAWRDGYFIHMQINARDMSYSKARDPGDTRKSTTPEKLAHLLNVFHRTRGRADHEIPTEQGVCIPNGFISGPPTDEENAGVIYHLRTVDDVYFSFDSDSGVTENDTLLDRVDATKPALKARDGKILRMGHRVVHGIKGEEILSTMRGDDGLLKENPMTQRFTFEANSKIGSAKTPILIVDFYNGVRKPEPRKSYSDDFPAPITKASLSEAEAIALWDTVMPTIRPRPGAF